MNLLAWTLPLVPLLFGVALVAAAGVLPLPGAVPSRVALLRTALESVAVLALARGLTAWGEVPAGLWWPPALLVATGLAASAARLPSLPLLDPARPARRQVLALGLDATVSTALIVLMLL